MKLPRSFEVCIACLNATPFPGGAVWSNEHIIPAALGGNLTCEFLCKTCNDRFGHTFEKRARTDPAIRLSVIKLKQRLPRLFDAIEDGQQWIIEAGGKRLPAIYKKGGVFLCQTRKIDGDLWASSDDTERSIQEMLRRRGHDDEAIQDTLKKLAAAPEQTEVSLGGGMFAISHPTKLIGPDLSKGESLAALVSLKIAYEFAVMSLGSGFLADLPPLNAIRTSLREGLANPKAFSVVPKITPDRQPHPFHGIAFIRGTPHVEIQVRLFGNLAYVVSFPKVTIDRKPFRYFHDLESGEDRTEA